MNRLQDNHLSAIGFGCLQLEELNEEVAVNLIVKAYEIGVNVFDTAACYGDKRHNEMLLGKAIKKIKQLYGEQAFLFFSTKCGINFGALKTDTRGYEAQPEQIRQSIETSLNVLGVKQIPLLYLHRIDPLATETELTKSFMALRQLVEEGKVKYIGLSEPTKEQILFADKILQTAQVSYSPLVAVQSALSVATQRAFKNGVFQACEELGIQFVSYTSNIRGLVNEKLSQEISLQELPKLSALEIISKVQKALNIPNQDFRFFVGFFDQSVIKKNIECILRFQQLAKEWSMSPSQLALAWQKAKKALPIPGTTKVEHLISNVESMKISLSTDQVKKIDDCFIEFEGNPNPPKMLDNEQLEQF